MDFSLNNSNTDVVCPYSTSVEAASMQPRFNKKITSPKTDAEVLQDVKDWMASKLHCVAGRREFNRGRYMIEVVGERSVKEIFASYKQRLQENKAIACLLVFNEPKFYEGRGNTSEAFYYLAEQIACLGNKCPHALANGDSLSNSIELRCPITNQMTVFDDFECIAFCPQSRDQSDPLYDPLMYSPYPAINISSDVYAFSRFVEDSARNFLKKPVHEETDMEKVEELFDKCVGRWQRVATTTINNFAAVTDTKICPVHLTEDQSHWAAAHKDPAFAEQEKVVHMHELPIRYAKRITDEWLSYFRGEQTYCAQGLAREGTMA